MTFKNQENKTVQVIIISLTIVLFTLVGFFFGNVVFPSSSTNTSLQINSSQFDKYNKVLNTLNNKFYYKDRLQNSKLQDSTIKGLTSALNDFPTRYLNAEEYSQYKQTIAGNIFGIGIEIGDSNDGSKIFSVYPDSPAEKSGLKKDDKFLTIDNKDVLKLTASELAALIRGPEGSTIKITVQRSNTSSTSLSFTIIRAKIYTKSIVFSKIDDGNFTGICQIKITRFTDDSVQTWENNWNEAINRFFSNNCKKLIIDLRNNGGGYVAAAQYAIGEFINDGKIIYGQKDGSGQVGSITSDRDKQSSLSSNNNSSIKIGRLRDIPVDILINSSSASASEIFAGSLQNNNRAKLIGTNSYGKGSEQATEEYSDGSALIYTITNWTLPNGQVIDQNYPIKPDFEILLNNTNTTGSNSSIDLQLDKAKDVLK